MPSLEKIGSDTQIVIRQVSGTARSVVRQPKSLNGFLGISINHRYFSRRTMECYFRWCQSHFDQFIILLMDDPDQFNFMVFQDRTDRQALEKARKIGADRKRGYQRSLSRMGIRNVRILQFRDFIQGEPYQYIRKQIQHEVEHNPVFYQSLYDLMQTGIGGKIQEKAAEANWTDCQQKKHEAVLLQYIISELAAIVYFTENGFPVEVDPTIEFRTKTELYQGKYPDLAERLNLTQRGHLFAHPQDHPKWSY